MSAQQVSCRVGSRVAKRPVLYVVPDPAQSSAGARCARSPKAHAAPVDIVRVAVTACAIAVAVLAAGFAGLFFQASPYEGATSEVVVQPGESVWSIASALDVSERSVDDLVNDIVRLNGLDSTALDVGQPLVVPAR